MNRISAEAVRTWVLEYLAERAAPGALAEAHSEPETFDFLAAGVIDSLGLLDLIGALERHFDVTVDFESMDPEAFTVIGPFARYVAERAVVDGGGRPE